VVGYQIGKPIKLVAFSTIIFNIIGYNVTKQNTTANGCAKCNRMNRYVWVKIN